MNMEKAGRIAFYVGLVISLAAGFVDIGANGIWGLVVLGIIVGALNVTGKEVHTFLLATVALLLVGWSLASIPSSVGFLQTILNHFMAFIAGAALLVALKEVYSVTKSA